MRIRSDYRICPLCGAALDIGEVCDCMEENDPTEGPQNGLNAPRVYKRPRKRKSGLKWLVGA